MRTFCLFAAVALVSGSVTAAPITVDFEDIALSTGPYYALAPSFTSRGYNFTSPTLVVQINGLALSPSGAANGTKALFLHGVYAGWPWPSSSDVTMTRAGGGTFRLSALDIAEAWVGRLDLAARSIGLMGYLGGAPVAGASFTLDLFNNGPGGANDFQSVFWSSGIVDKIVISGFGGPSGVNAFSLDNLIAEPVPTPGALALLGLGLLGLGALRRRLNKISCPHNSRRTEP